MARTTTSEKSYIDPVQGNGIKIVVNNFGGKKSPKIKIFCLDCEASLEIFGQPEDDDQALEINGVYASKEMWRRILLPLLDVKVKNPVEFKLSRGILKI